ncbi:kinetochore protein Nuf2-like isoform X1 [Rhea pennata]|uniref:kinetochore protein Nuf2-like isoform X1 n=1 Tax=Rhea pennata TaxID=8795 RepID=UPI002E276B45
MEVLTFRRCSPADIATCLRGHVRAGCEARSLAKGDLFPGPKMPVNIDIVYPQIFEGFLPVCNLFIHMERFLPVCRVNDFEIADVLSPKAKRTARFLSGILNFIHFRESRCGVYLDLQK